MVPTHVQLLVLVSNDETKPLHLGKTHSCGFGPAGADGNYSLRLKNNGNLKFQGGEISTRSTHQANNTWANNTPRRRPEPDVWMRITEKDKWLCDTFFLFEKMAHTT
jgi:hypothetical protein